MQRIIITADDYGMCDEVDHAIDSGVNNGFITSTNVMVNMYSLPNAALLRARFPWLSVGIHWNVTTGKPVSDPKSIPSLVDDSGVFWEIDKFKKKYRCGEIARQDLEKELEAQYLRFKEVCGEPDYWNTHENSSLELRSFKAFESVAKRHGIPATRTFQRVYYDRLKLGVKTALREFAVKTFFQIWFEQIRKSFKMPTARVVSFDRISKTDGDVLLNALKKDGRDLIEVVFHPATTADSPYFGNISQERVKEYLFTSSSEVRQRFASNGFAFVGYDALTD